MQATCLENNPKTSGFDDELKLDVLLMHEDLPAGLRGQQVLDQAAEWLGMKAAFYVNYWRFDQLNEPSLHNQAVEEARQANIVVLAMRNCSKLPTTVRLWIKQWMQNRCHAPCAIVVSLDAEAQVLRVAQPALHYVRTMADSAGVDVFPHYGETPQVVWNWTVQKVQRSGSADRKESIVCAPEPHFAWGINE